MNKYQFALRNILDKIVKATKNPEMLIFYWRTYIVSKLARVNPNVYIISYPKCGRTWVRVMLQNYISLNKDLSNENNLDNYTFNVSQNQQNIIIKFSHDQSNWVPAPRAIEQLHFNFEKYANKKIIFLVRDPRDVVVSSWYHLKYRENIYKRDLSSFVHDDLVGINKVIAFMNLWLENASRLKSFLLITYESLHQDIVANFENIIKFIGLEVKNDLVQRAVEEARFDKMKKIEKNGALKEPWMKPGAKNLEESMKVRKGKVGGFRQELSKEDIDYVNKIMAQKLSPKLLQFYQVD